MKQILTIFLLGLTMISGVAQAAIQTIKVEVNGMVCAFCAQGIEKKMRSLTQTQDVYVDLRNKVVAVQLKDGQKLSHDTVKELIKDAGYDVTKIETVGDSAQQIKAATRAKK
jgi:periplasmic mercuric ion binding protein